MRLNRFSAGAALWFVLVVLRALWWWHSQQPLPELPQAAQISGWTELPISSRTGVLLPEPLPPCEDEAGAVPPVADGLRSCR